MLINTIKKDLKYAMMEKDETKKSTLRMVLGEVPRLNLKADQVPSDEQIHGIIKKLVKAEMVILDINGDDRNDSEYIKTLESYLPTMMSQQEIIDWIKDNIDFSKYNVPIKAMGEIMKQLKGKADGTLVRDLLKAKI